MFEEMHVFCRLILVAGLLIAGCLDAPAAPFVAIGDRTPLALAALVKRIEQADVIFLGEIHDDPRHHQTQLEIICTLLAGTRELAIGLEMFTTDDQRALDDWVAGKLDEESFLPVYARNWSFDWPLYRELFIFARDHQLPLIALNVPKATMARMVDGGIAALHKDELPPDLDWQLNTAQSYYMRTIAGQVFGRVAPDQMVTRLSRAQALRNQEMAWNLARYRKAHPKETVVVLAGTWHAVKNGVPERLERFAPLTSSVILPELPEFNLENATVNDADFLMMK
jgi:uncharacterized iron-regulated protein